MSIIPFAVALLPLLLLTKRASGLSEQVYTVLKGIKRIQLKVMAQSGRCADSKDKIEPQQNAVPPPFTEALVRANRLELCQTSTKAA